MKQQVTRIGITLLLFLALSGQYSCAAAQQLTTKGTNPADITGSYTLMLYGCKYPDDIENAAILVDEHSPYVLDIFSLPTMYSVQKGLPAQEALAKANKFLRCTFHTVVETRVRMIADDRGGTIGYDMRPAYLPYDIGSTDPLLITYRLKDGKVTAYIRLSPDVRRRDDGDMFDRGRDGRD